MAENDELGRGIGKQGEWAEDEEVRAARQRAEPEALEVEGDPRGGLQAEDYRTADPREVVEEGGVVMSAPGGAPQEDLSIEERRRLGEAFRHEADADDPSPGGS